MNVVMLIVNERMEVQSESIEVYSSAEGYGGRNENVYEEMD